MCCNGVRNRPVSVSVNDNKNELYAEEAFMPRRQILSSEEKERLLVVPDDDVLLTRMCFLSEHDLALINKHRGQLTAWLCCFTLLFARTGVSSRQKYVPSRRSYFQAGGSFENSA
jgi:hypothetical protein